MYLVNILFMKDTFKIFFREMRVYFPFDDGYVFNLHHTFFIVFQLRLLNHIVEVSLTLNHYRATAKSRYNLFS